jgi:hypothetical protein
MSLKPILPAKLVVMVAAKFASFPKAVANSLSVSNTPGAEFISAFI